jgi:peptidyl-prolyl cis-trans isomerase C
MSEEMKSPKSHVKVKKHTISVVLVYLMALVVSTAGLSANAKTTSPVLVVVNGDSIFTRDVDAIFAKIHSGLSNEEKQTFDYHKLITKLVNDHLLMREAEHVGMADDSAFVSYLEEQKRDMATRMFVTSAFTSKDSVSEQEVLQYFGKNYGKKQIRTISVKTADQAKQILASIKKGASMDSVAREVSVDIWRYQGGLHSPKYVADIEADLRAVCLKLHDGEYSQPFPYRDVYAFMKLEKSINPDTSELPKHREYIASILKSQRHDAAWQAFLDKERSTYAIRIDSGAVASLTKQAEKGIDSSFMKGSSRPVVVIASRENITDQDLRNKLAHSSMMAGNEPINSLARKVLNNLINDKVLYLEAAKQGLNQDAKILRKVAEIRDSALIEIYLKETVVSQVKFSHKEFDEYYQSHQDDFREPDEYFLKQVVVSSKALADSIEDALADGADYDYTIGKFVTDKLTSNQKEQWYSLIAFPQQIQNDLVKLANGQSSKRYPTTEGFVIFKVKDRRHGKVRPESEVEMNIREIIFQKKFDALLDKTLGLLKKNSQIVYFNAAIDNYLGATK